MKKALLVTNSEQSAALLKQLLREEGKLFSEEYTAEGTLVDVMVDVKRQKKAQEFVVE